MLVHCLAQKADSVLGRFGIEHVVVHQVAAVDVNHRERVVKACGMLCISQVRDIPDQTWLGPVAS